MKAMAFFAPGWRAYSVDAEGENLPAMLGPWNRHRIIDAPQEAEDDLRRQGYWIVRSKE